VSRPRSSLSPLLATLTVLLSACPGPTPVYDGGADFQRAGDGAELCRPNNDGVIDRSELTFVVGLGASYLVNPPGTVVGFDPAGQLLEGATEWDFSSTAGERAAVKLEPIAGTWFAKHFPKGTFAAGADIKAETLQVLSLDQGQLLLLGLASRQPDSTLMIYDTPIPSLRFPLRLGDTINARSTVTDGKLNGMPIATEDTYDIKVDAQGTVRLPSLKLQRSLRVSIAVQSKAVGGVRRGVRQLQWFHECYGEVVRAVSQADEPAPEFGTATELRRLTY
jgi:hypothetical protein